MGFVKLCGMMKSSDVKAAHAAGADAIGLVVDFPPSVRSLNLEATADLASESEMPVVALLVDPDAAKLRSVIQAVHPWAVQLAGHESTDEVRALKVAAGRVELWKVLHVPATGSSSDAGVTTPNGLLTQANLLASNGGVDAEDVFQSGDGSELDVNALVTQAQAYQSAGIDRIMLDAHHDELPGGTGLRLDWSTLVDLIGSLRLPIVLAGGLTPDNVAQAIELSGTAAVDVSSGIESAPGVKDPELMTRFVLNARQAFDD